jgi:hypothetical protein
MVPRHHTSRSLIITRFAFHQSRQILVGRTNDDLLHVLLLKARSGGCLRIVSLKFDYGPDDKSQSGNGFLSQRKLRKRDWVNPCTRFVSSIEVVAKRLDHVIEGNANMCYPRTR